MSNKTIVELETNWVIDAPPEEMSLILKALGGRLRPEEERAARDLGNRITELRAKLSQNLANDMAKHANNIRKED